MNCPNCGKEMASGTMYADKYPYWTQQKNLPVFRTPKDMVMLRPLGDTSTETLSFPFHDYPNTMLCRGCGIVVFPYQIKE
ncbi:MAG: PF20097 family protein [Lawsonibacter sp.]|nr:PF20097 family protein [Lawsonibacter sp.]